jgi:hypothetical protein
MDMTYLGREVLEDAMDYSILINVLNQKKWHGSERTVDTMPSKYKILQWYCLFI